MIAAALAYAAFALLLPVLLLHPRIRRGFWQRMGLFPALELGEGPRVWLHGASAGDVLGLLPMVRELRALRPEVRIVISAITDSGAAMAENRLRRAGLADAVVYLPFDLPGACRRALRRIRPDVLVLEYTELWPQLIRASREASVRLVMTNGRLSPKNLGRYRRLFGLTGNLLQRFDLLLMRAEEEAERALSLGADPAVVRVTGNTKFDALASSVIGSSGSALAAELGPLSGPLWVCGSTHEGEEGLLLDVFVALRRKFPSLRLLIAPRYIERAGRVAALVRERGLRYRLRTQPSGGRDEVLILDTVGELVAAYQLATVVFVGGSFTSRGGQNILEPAACGKPVLFGPRMENFADCVQVLLGRGGLQVRSPEALARLLAELLERPQELADLGQLALAAVSAVSGAGLRNAQLIADCLPAGRREQRAG